MYLAKYELDMKEPQARRAVSDKQNLHSLVQTMFNTDRKTSDVLYRLNGRFLYMSSNKEPANIEGLRFINGRSVEEVDGVRGFSIVTIPRKGVDRKKLSLKTEEQRIEWLRRQGRKNGFEILFVREMGFEMISSKKKGFNVVAHRYDGKLLITDKEKFAKARLEGIGPMRAYGCGMLLVA